MKISVHIGLEKTGTTTIQAFLNQNRPVLLAKGVLYPRAPGRNNQTLLAAAAMSEDLDIRVRAIAKHGRDFATKLVHDLEAEIACASASRLLFSNEHCSSRLRTEEEVRRLKGMLDRFGEVEAIIVYLRRQDEFLISSYSTSVKSGSVMPFVTPTGKALSTRYDFRALLELWGGVFDRATLRPRRFQPSAWTSGNLLTDFCAAAYLDIAQPDAPSRNLSLSAEGLEMLRMINERSGGVRNGQVVRAVSALTEGPKLSLSTAARRAFVRNFDASNAWVSEAFFDGGPLFDEVPEDIPDYLPPAITPERFAELRDGVEAIASEKERRRRARLE